MKIWSVFWVRANARNVSFKVLYGDQFTLSAQVDETKLPYLSIKGKITERWLVEREGIFS